MTRLTDFTATTLHGTEQPLSAYAGDVVLVVNTASKCGLTPQFAGLEALYQEYHSQGLSILGFPCNQFAGQEPGSAEDIEEFCQVNYGVTFPMFAKIDVNGKSQHPLYRWLKSEAPGPLGKAIPWNFTTFLVGRDGAVIRRDSPQTEPAELRTHIEAALAAPRPSDAGLDLA